MASSYNGVPPPAGGSPIVISGGKLQVPDNPIIPYIEGDGTGRDIWSRPYSTARRRSSRRQAAQDPLVCPGLPGEKGFTEVQRLAAARFGGRGA